MALHPRTRPPRRSSPVLTRPRPFFSVHPFHSVHPFCCLSPSRNNQLLISNHKSRISPQGALSQAKLQNKKILCSLHPFDLPKRYTNNCHTARFSLQSFQPALPDNNAILFQLPLRLK